MDSLLTTIRKTTSEICNEYCKYTDKYQKNANSENREISDDEYIELINNHCRFCPLYELMSL